jgi:hypothetical protein
MIYVRSSYRRWLRSICSLACSSFKNKNISSKYVTRKITNLRSYMKKISLKSKQWKHQASTTNCSGDVLVQTSTILQIIYVMPKVITDMRDSAVLNQTKQKRHLEKIDENLTVKTDKIKKVDVDINLAVSLALRLSTRISQTILRLFSLVLEIKKLVQL